MNRNPPEEAAYEDAYKKKNAYIAPDDPRPEWEKEDREIEDRKPDLSETEEDTANL